LIDGAALSIHRVEYDIERESKAKQSKALGQGVWAPSRRLDRKTLLAAAPQIP